MVRPIHHHHHHNLPPLHRQHINPNNVVHFTPASSPSSPHIVIVGFDVCSSAYQNLTPPPGLSPRSVIINDETQPDLVGPHHHHQGAKRSALGGLLSCCSPSTEGAPAAEGIEEDYESSYTENVEEAVHTELSTFISETKALIYCAATAAAGEGRGGGGGGQVKQAAAAVVLLGGMVSSDAAGSSVDRVADLFYSHGQGGGGGVLMGRPGAKQSIFCAASPVSIATLEQQASDFLHSCFYCKTHLAQGTDIFMYRGDEAFCSSECRQQQISMDEHKEQSSILLQEEAFWKGL